MIFGQLTGRDSLRDLMVSIEPHKPKYYHLGFGKGTSRSNFPTLTRNVIAESLKSMPLILQPSMESGAVLQVD